MTHYSGESKRWTNAEIFEATNALAGTVANEFDYIRDEKIGKQYVRKLDVTSHVGIRHLERFHRGLIGNIAVFMPEEDDPALDHLAFIETILRTRITAGPNPAFSPSVEDIVLLELHHVVDGLSRVRKLGSELIERWDDASGEHFICEHDGGCELGVVGDAPSDALTVDYSDLAQKAMYPTAVDYANWLLNVDGDYPMANLYHATAEDPIAYFHLNDAPLTRSGAWSGYSTFLEKETPLIAGGMRGIQDPVRDIVVGNAQVKSFIDQLPGNRAERINLFVKRSDPRVATPFLQPIMEGAENPDIADIIQTVSLHYSEGTARRKPLNEQGKNWLRGLGIIG